MSRWIFNPPLFYHLIRSDSFSQRRRVGGSSSDRDCAFPDGADLKKKSKSKSCWEAAEPRCDCDTSDLCQEQKNMQNWSVWSWQDQNEKACGDYWTGTLKHNFKIKAFLGEGETGEHCRLCRSYVALFIYSSLPVRKRFPPWTAIMKLHLIRHLLMWNSHVYKTFTTRALVPPRKQIWVRLHIGKEEMMFGFHRMLMCFSLFVFLPDYEILEVKLYFVLTLTWSWS